MRPSILHSAALSLAGFWVVDASVCKPRSLSSRLPTVASTTLIGLGTTSSAFAPESSVLSSTILSASIEVTTGVDTTTTDATTTKIDTATIEATFITIVSASTEVTSTSELSVATQTPDSTETTASAETTASSKGTISSETTSITKTTASTEATASSETTALSGTTTSVEATASTEVTASSGTTPITDTTTAPTSIQTTTTIDTTTTTTAELPAITNFQLRGARDPVEGVSIYSNGVGGNYLLFSGGYPGYTIATFSVEAISGRLLTGNSLGVCAFFQPNQDIATLSICRDTPESQAVPISCTTPVKDGDVLSCSVPAQTCVETSISFFETTVTCTPTGEVLTDTSTDYNYDLYRNIPVMGQIANGVNFVVHAV